MEREFKLFKPAGKPDSQSAELTPKPVERSEGRKLLDWDKDSYPDRGLCADMPELTDYLYPDVLKGRIGFPPDEVTLPKVGWAARVRHNIVDVFSRKSK